MPISSTDLNKAYLAYFGRPSDISGRATYANKEAADVVSAFDSSAESKALYGDSIVNKINAIYVNLFNRDAEPAGLQHWLSKVMSGELTPAGVAIAILNGAQNDDAKAVANKLAAADAFTKAIDTTAEILGYSGMAAVNSARAFLKTVDATEASLTAAVKGAEAAVAAATTAGSAQANQGQTFTLTTGIDTLTGTAGNDTFNSSPVSGVATFSGLDSIDGGAGKDTLNIDFGATAAALSTTANIKNIEVLNVASTAGLNIDVSNIAGITDVSAVNGSATVAQTIVNGGKVVSVNGGVAKTGTENAVRVTGNELTSVTVKNTKEDSATTNSTVVVNNTAATGTGKTLTSVTLENLGTDIATLTGDALNSVTVKGQKTALATTVVNTVSTDLTVNVDGAGYDAAGAAVADVSVTAGAKAATITVNATGSKSNVTVAETTAGAAKTLNLTGSANLALGAVGASLTGLTTIAGAAATGNLDLGTLGASAATVTTGSGNDKFQLAATKVTVDAGAGNDTVTLGSTLALGSTVKLGDGNDTLLSAGGVVTGKDATGTVTIDAGAGTDSVAASLVNAANATQFLNFEQIDLSKQGAAATVLDVALMTGSTITGLTLNGDGAGVNTGNTVQNLAAGAGLTVAGANTKATTIGVKDAATGTADAFTVTFAGADVAGATATAANVTAGTIGLSGIEALTIASNGGSNTWNSIDLGLNKSLKTITITGDKNLDLTFGLQNGADTPSATAGVSSIDGSAATGKLKITVDADVKAVTTGLVVKGGSAADTIITGAASTTLSGNGGTDAFDVKAALAGGTVGTSTSAAVLEANAVKTTITDFVKGETIQLAAVAAAQATATKITLDSTVQNLDQALDKVVNTVGTFWFNYGADTYVVYNAATDAGLDQGDVLVKLTGTLDLSNSTTTDGLFTFA